MYSLGYRVKKFLFSFDLYKPLVEITDDVTGCISRLKERTSIFYSSMKGSLSSAERDQSRRSSFGS